MRVALRLCGALRLTRLMSIVLAQTAWAAEHPSLAEARALHDLGDYDGAIATSWRRFSSPGCEPTSGVVEPGDVLFIPERWWHTAESLSTSITLSGNWVERSNWEAFFERHFLDHVPLMPRVREV